MIGGRLAAFSLHAAFLCYTVIFLSFSSEYAFHALPSVCATMAQTLVIHAACICPPPLRATSMFAAQTCLGQ